MGIIPRARRPSTQPGAEFPAATRRAYRIKLVLQSADMGQAFARILAGGGVFVFAIHAYFLLRGNAVFRLPASIAMLAALLVISIAQAIDISCPAWLIPVRLVTYP